MVLLAGLCAPAGARGMPGTLSLLTIVAVMPRFKRPDGTEIEWAAGGDGALAVLVNPFFAHPEAFEGLVGELEAGHRVVKYAPRGMGGSTPAGPHSLTTDAEDLAALLEALGEPAVLVALGDGVNRAVHAAARVPELVVAVVTPGGNPAGLAAAAGSEGLAGSESVIGALIQLMDTDYRAAMRTMVQNANPDMDEDSIRDRVNRTVAYCPPEAGAPRLRDWVTDDAIADARALADRLWILEHGGNLWFSTDVLPRTRELLPRAHVHEVADGPFSRPDITAATVAQLTGTNPLAPTGRSG